MIAHIKGQIIHKGLGFIVVETGGIGYKITITTETQNTLTTSPLGLASLWIYQAIREDSSDLYGFISIEELNFFELLISISGVGPKTAIGVLNASSIENLQTAISSGETSYLTKISGIGRKLAEKIVFELKEKIGGERTEMTVAMKGDADVLEALISLGYNEREAREAIKKLPNDVIGANNRVKAVLKFLGK